ncbi:amidohydrolase family protein [Acidimangrovimonas sediminis]|uniref:amidohydrolase family protein n=1 Tax=Acidimangrovimonas sediminis TaxID=2056283 RepID=UPI000C7FFD4A|nr:amidohydrolase family protein [Acidimangrovimonas sediminis]
MERSYTGTPPAIRLPQGAVDTQMHLYMEGYPAAPGSIGLPPAPLPVWEDYRKVMDWLGISRFIITQGNAHLGDNANLLACLDQTRDHARGVAVIDGTEDATELSRLDDGGVIGARIMDLPGGAVGLPALKAVDARTRDMGWMMAVQFDGSDILDHEARLGAIGSRWVLDHHGKFFRGATPDGPEMAAVKRLIDRGNVWYKIAGCYESSLSGGPDYADVAAMTRVIAAHAPDRIVWGTNWPHNLAKTAADYPDDAQLLDATLGWLPEEGRQRALVDNAEALFGGRLPPR